MNNLNISIIGNQIFLEIMKELKFKSRWMARRIVQTETTGAANFAISDAASDLFG